MQSAAKVGLLVVVFVALLVGAYAVLGKSLFGKASDTYYAMFQDASGLAESTPVLMAGVKIGAVDKVELSGPKLARVTFKVDKGTTIPTGSVASVSSPLIGLGDTPMSILTPTNIAGNLSPGATLSGTKAGPLDDILPDSKTTMRELNRTLVSVRKLLEDKGLKQRTEKLLATSEKTLDMFGKLANNANGMLSQNQQAISEAIRSATLALNDVHRVTTQVASMLEDGKLQHDTKGLVAKMGKIADKADKLMVSMNDLVSDPKLKQAMTTTTDNVAQITSTGKEIAENTRQITEQGVEISKNASAISAKAVPLMDKANDVMSRATDIEDQLSGVLDRVGGFFSRKSGPGPLSNIGLTMDLMRETNPGYWRTDVGFSFPLADTILHAGLYDAFGSNKLTVQLGKQATPKLQYRYGVYAAKPGVGVDYQLAPKVTLRGDVWDINRLRVDLRARYDFGNGIVGWVGVDSLFDRNAATIGIGIRR
jgi:ABC-type transporter Mla subunit MlaD